MRAPGCCTPPCSSYSAMTCFPVHHSHAPTPITSVSLAPLISKVSSFASLCGSLYSAHLFNFTKPLWKTSSHEICFFPSYSRNTVGSTYSLNCHVSPQGLHGSHKPPLELFHDPKDASCPPPSWIVSLNFRFFKKILHTDFQYVCTGLNSHQQ